MNLEFALAVVAVQYYTASAVVQPHLVVEVDAEPAVGVDSVVRERVAAGQEPLGAARVRAEPRREEPARQHAGARRRGGARASALNRWR